MTYLTDLPRELNDHIVKLAPNSVAGKISSASNDLNKIAKREMTNKHKEHKVAAKAIISAKKQIWGKAYDPFLYQHRLDFIALVKKGPTTEKIGKLIEELGNVKEAAAEKAVVEKIMQAANNLENAESWNHLK